MNSKINKKYDDLKKKALVAEVVRRYYIEDEGQKVIAAALKISQAEVSRAIRFARENKIIQFRINPIYTINIHEIFKKSFPHVKELVVVPFSLNPGVSGDQFLEFLGEQSAHYFIEMVKHKSQIGIGCGHSVEATIRAIGRLRKEGHGLPRECRVFQMMIMKTQEVETVTPASLVSDLLRWLPEAKGKAFQFPPDTHSFKCQNHPEIQKLLSSIKNLDFYLTGIGRVDSRKDHDHGSANTFFQTGQFNSIAKNLKLSDVLRNLGACGEMVHQPFDIEGKLLIEHKSLRRLRETFLYLPLEKLKQRVEEICETSSSSRVIGIGGGKNKAPAIRGALHGKFFNVLITDVETLTEILKGEGLWPEEIT